MQITAFFCWQCETPKGLKVTYCKTLFDRSLSVDRTVVTKVTPSTIGDLVHLGICNIWYRYCIGWLLFVLYFSCISIIFMTSVFIFPCSLKVILICYFAYKIFILDNADTGVSYHSPVKLPDRAWEPASSVEFFCLALFLWCESTAAVLAKQEAVSARLHSLS